VKGVVEVVLLDVWAITVEALDIEEGAVKKFKLFTGVVGSLRET
jgi:hypothetical protein